MPINFNIRLFADADIADISSLVLLTFFDTHIVNSFISCHADAGLSDGVPLLIRITAYATSLEPSQTLLAHTTHSL